jgi:hypothetical protein
MKRDNDVKINNLISLLSTSNQIYWHRCVRKKFLDQAAFPAESRPPTPPGYVFFSITPIIFVHTSPRNTSITAMKRADQEDQQLEVKNCAVFTKGI